MLTIDGSQGEGGGQILRTSLALSVATKTPIQIINIRSKRPQPGLKPQHYTVASLLKKLSNAETKGLEIGSTSLFFSPQMVQEGKYEIDIGTAGSIVLVLQSVLLSTLHILKPVSLLVHGGTDVKWAPSWDYFHSVFLPVLQKMGVDVSVRLLKRGYYPKGGGCVEMRIAPLLNELQPFEYIDPYPISQVQGIIYLSGLPDHIAKRMKHVVLKELLKENIHALIHTEKCAADSAGVGITLWPSSDTRFLGSIGLGEKGVPAEKIASLVVKELVKDIRSSATVDQFLCDQILPFCCFSSHASQYQVRVMSSHADTNRNIVNMFDLPNKCHVFSLMDGGFRVACSANIQGEKHQ